MGCDIELSFMNIKSKSMSQFNVKLLRIFFARRNRNRLKASEFVAGDAGQMVKLRRMGVSVVTMKDGRVQLLHTASEVSATDKYIITCI